MNAGADRVPGTVDKVFAESRAFDDAARCLIDLPARDGPRGGHRVDHQPRGGLARIAHDLKDSPLALVGLADDAGPGDVVIDRAGSIQLGPDIEQDEVAGLKIAGEFLIGLIMRVSGICAGGNDRRRIGHQVLALKCLFDPLADGPLVPAAVADAMADLLKCGGHDGVHVIAGGEVGCDLCLGQRRLEARDQVGGGADLDAEAADELDDSGIGQRDRRDLAAWRVLHGNAAIGLEYGREPLMQLAPAGVVLLRAGQCAEVSGLHAMIEPDGLGVALIGRSRGDEIEPTARGVNVGEAEDRIGDLVSAMMVVEEPGVEVLLAQRLLNRGEIHGGIL